MAEEELPKGGSKEGRGEAADGGHGVMWDPKASKERKGRERKSSFFFFLFGFFFLEELLGLSPRH